MFDWWFDRGAIKKVIVEQADLRDQLRIVFLELERYILNTKGLSDSILKGLKEKLREISSSLNDLDLLPSEYALKKLFYKMLRSEVGMFYSTAKTHKKITDGLVILKTLVPRHMQDELKYYTKGSAGVFRGSAFLVAFSTVSGGGYSLTALYDYLFWEKNQRLKCAEAKTEKEFRECVEEYLKKKYPFNVSLGILSGGKIRSFEWDKLSKKQQQQYINDIIDMTLKRITRQMHIEALKRFNKDIANIVKRTSKIRPCIKIEDKSKFYDCMKNYIRGKFKIAEKLKNIFDH